VTAASVRVGVGELLQPVLKHERVYWEYSIQEYSTVSTVQ
jgi:hypothetical protein